MYSGHSNPESFPVNVALAELVKSPETNDICQEHPTKPLDYYCLKCFTLICADCFIFGKHQEHKLSKKKELKDLNSYLISTLDNLYKKNEHFEALKSFDDVEGFLAMKINFKLEEKRTEIDEQINVRCFLVNILENHEFVKSKN
jgi:hypothetical protein